MSDGLPGYRKHNYFCILLEEIQRKGFIYENMILLQKLNNNALTKLSQYPQSMFSSKIIIWKAQGVPQ